MLTRLYIADSIIYKLNQNTSIIPKISNIFTPMYVGTTFRGSNADMQLFHNGQSDLVHPNLDYDIVSLSNAFAYSFEQGVNLASSMLNAPFLIANLYDYVVMHSETLGIDDPEWTRIVKTRSCSPMGTALSKNIYSVMIPNIGKFLYYSTSEPTMRQKQLATYIAWIVSQFSREKFYTSDFAPLLICPPVTPQ